MSKYTPAFFLLFLHFTFIPATLQQGTLPPIGLNPERFKIMKDALSWMTFRKDGKLATEQELAPFLEALRVNYTQSKYFRTLIVAFQYGVLPRLTLNENDRCDSAYTLDYRDPYNNSVTYGYIKKFMFKYYDERSETSVEFCDYRQGLVCNQQTMKCECPQGSRMGPISQGSSVQRCLVQENEICALIDLDHDPTSEYGALKKVLPEMLFNLEKPLSCKMGTQCRFKSNKQSIPSCYKNDGGPWAEGRWELDFGDECTLGLYADKGPCRSCAIRFSRCLGAMPGYTCYNFGALKPPVSKLVGICAHEVGSYGIASTLGQGQGEWSWDPLFIGTVSPATTPLRGATYRNYITKFTNDVYGPFTQYGYLSTFTDQVNGSCNVTKTEEVLDHWKFFLSLDEAPPPGKDYVATEPELQKRMQRLEDLTVNWSKKTCKVYSESERYYYNSALRCVADRAFVDQYGNDGRCERVPEMEDATSAYARKFNEIRKHIGDIDWDQKNEEHRHRKELIGSSELECDPKLGRPPGSEGAPPSQPGDNDVLEGGYCPPDRGCYLNYGDYQNIYDSYCRYRDSRGEEALSRDCQWMDESRKFGKCEEKKLDEKMRKEMKKFSSSNGLGREDQCDIDFEIKMRDAFKRGGYNVYGNKYRVLWQIQNGNYKVRGVGLCDRTRMLRCRDGACECMPGTAPRKVTVGGVEYMSDYCYVTSGNCDDDRLETIYNYGGDSSYGEKADIDTHYKAKRGHDKCEGSNWCVYIKGDSCTTQNTGNTGLSCKEGKCGWQWAAGERKQLNGFLKMISVMSLWYAYLS